MNKRDQASSDRVTKALAYKKAEEERQAKLKAEQDRLLARNKADKKARQR